MSDGTTDDLKGRAKEAAGDLTDDKSLKNEGKVDRAVVGQAIEKYRLFDVNAGTSGNAGGES